MRILSKLTEATTALGSSCGSQREEKPTTTGDQLAEVPKPFLLPLHFPEAAMFITYLLKNLSGGLSRGMLIIS